jgi:large subunit ribosomal protein L19
MSKHPQIAKYEETKMKKDVPEFNIGDTLSVHLRILEDGGKERIQVFTGTLIARKGVGVSETISLHRIAYGEGMERVFFLHSPLIAKVELGKKGKVRRSKLYYLRGKSGKAAKIKGRYEAEANSQKAQEGAADAVQTTES